MFAGLAVSYLDFNIWDSFRDLHSSLPSTVKSLSTTMHLSKSTFSLLENFTKMPPAWPDINYSFTITRGSVPLHLYPDQIGDLESRYLPEDQEGADLSCLEAGFPLSPPKVTKAVKSGEWYFPILIGCN